MKKALLSLLLIGAFIPARADISETELADLKGYTILGGFTITGWMDPDKGKKGDAFEGCEYGRVLILDNNLAVTCEEYSYSYSYHPRVVILGDGRSLRMLLGGHLYRVKR